MSTPAEERRTGSINQERERERERKIAYETSGTEDTGVYTASLSIIRDSFHFSIK